MVMMIMVVVVVVRMMEINGDDGVAEELMLSGKSEQDHWLNMVALDVVLDYGGGSGKCEDYGNQR